MTSAEQVRKALIAIRHEIQHVLPFDSATLHPLVFDFSGENHELVNIDLMNTMQFSAYIDKEMQQHRVSIAIGRYNEHRTIYARSSLFQGHEPRTVHLGIDLFTAAKTPVFAPLPGIIHSFQNNAAFGDYGPTIILEHEVNGVRFYTLYGHLSEESLHGIKHGQSVAAGEQIAAIGNYPSNGSWPPHLHFQIITDMQGRTGDFPGVASLTQREQFLELCPDPNLILRIKSLQ